MQREYRQMYATRPACPNSLTVMLHPFDSMYYSAYSIETSTPLDKHKITVLTGVYTNVQKNIIKN
jgi:hypothetical protein